MKILEYMETRVLVWFALLAMAEAETRYACISGGYGGDDRLGLGEREFGDGDFGDFGDFESTEMGDGDGLLGGGGLTGGSLTCPLGNRASILVKRVAYGVSMIGSRCETASYCREEFDTGDVIAGRCDGRSSCFIDYLPPVFLKCGRRSSYTLVEYECIDEWATFGVCESVSTVARGPSIFITSPGYLSSRGPGSRRGTQMCECIVQSEDRSSVYLDYLQTQMSSDNGKCPYEYVTIESKRDINQTTIDKELEVCGRRHVGGRWFEGSIRITYASGGPMQRKGLIVKFTADSRSRGPRLEVECGAVNSTKLKLAKPPSQNSSPSSSRPYLPAVPLGIGLPHFNMRSDFDRALSMGALGRDDGMIDDGTEHLLPTLASFPHSLGGGLSFGGGLSGMGGGVGGSMGRGGGPLGAPGTGPFGAVADRPQTPWKINLPKKPQPQPSAPTKQLSNQFKATVKPATAVPTSVWVTRTVAAPVLPTRNKPIAFRPAAGTMNNRRQLPAKTGRRPQTGIGISRRAGVGTKRSNKIVDEPGIVNTPVDKPDTAGSLVGVVFGGIGGLLILASFGILVLNKLRKRQRRKRRIAEYSSYNGSASMTYGKGWEMDRESVYATVADVTSGRSECANPAADTNCQETKFISEAEVEKILKGQCTVQASATAKDGDGKAGASRNIEVAVIEVHQSFGADDSADVKQTENYLPDCGYTSVKKADKCEGRPGSCVTCNITRPPRRNDNRHGYDNNIGIKRTSHDV